MRVLVIPDVHLKGWMFDWAEEIGQKEKVDAYVCLMDIADDWEKYDEELYASTYDRAIEFAKKHPTKSFFCMGNHDYSYMECKDESGFLPSMIPVVIKKLHQLKQEAGKRLAIVHRLDKVIFSHGGICDLFVSTFMEELYEASIDEIIEQINNRFGVNELWKDISPLWFRCTKSVIPMFRENELLQVVGHTPVKTIMKYGCTILTDTFSTQCDGENIGDQSFAIVDTETGKFEIVYVDVEEDTYED